MVPPSSSSSSISPHLRPPRCHQFTPIQEGNESEGRGSERRRPSNHHESQPDGATAVAGGRRSRKKRPLSIAVSCNYCRPSSRENPTASVVPVADGEKNNFSHTPSLNGVLRSILDIMATRSAKPSPETFSASPAATNEERWKIAAAELSHKLVQATRKREEATLEASRLRLSIAELENKLNKLEVHFRNLRSSFEIPNDGGTINHHIFLPDNRLPLDGNDPITGNFVLAVSQSRNAVRSLCRALIQIRKTDAKVFDRISSLIQPYDFKISISKTSRTLIFYLEALLNSTLFEDFESAGFSKNSPNRILNPVDRCEAQYAAFCALRGLTWEDVLIKGTKHFSEDFSKFCDEKMGEIVGLLGWNRAWPEPLLRAFFGATKSVWLVHLLANSVHPSLPIFRLEKGSSFDSAFMEEIGTDGAVRRQVPTNTVVQIMVAPGFYVYDDVIKSKILCKYDSVNNSVTMGLGAK